MRVDSRMLRRVNRWAQSSHMRAIMPLSRITAKTWMLSLNFETLPNSIYLAMGSVSSPFFHWGHQNTMSNPSLWSLAGTSYCGIHSPYQPNGLFCLRAHQPYLWAVSTWQFDSHFKAISEPPGHANVLINWSVSLLAPHTPASAAHMDLIWWMRWPH